MPSPIGMVVVHCCVLDCVWLTFVMLVLTAVVVDNCQGAASCSVLIGQGSCEVAEDWVCVHGFAWIVRNPCTLLLQLLAALHETSMGIIGVDTCPKTCQLAVATFL